MAHSVALRTEELKDFVQKSDRWEILENSTRLMQSLGIRTCDNLWFWWLRVFECLWFRFYSMLIPFHLGVNQSVFMKRDMVNSCQGWKGPMILWYHTISIFSGAETTGVSELLAVWHHSWAMRGSFAEVQRSLHGSMEATKWSQHSCEGQGVKITIFINFQCDG